MAVVDDLPLGFTFLPMAEQADAPASPAAGSQRFFIADDGKPYIVSSSGLVVPLAATDAATVDYDNAGSGLDAANVQAALDELAAGAGGGGGGGGGVLAVAEATASAAYATSTNVDADMDATNLSVTFTVPTSGRVLVVQSAYVSASGSGVATWTVREGTSTLKQASVLFGSSVLRGTAHHRITGLTPGVTKTYKWGHNRGPSGSTTTYTGGNGGSNGNAIMHVLELP